MLSRANILCHRGFWSHPGEKNAVTAFERAVEHGFGIETDIRDSGSRIVIGHDPFSRGNLSLLDFLEKFASRASGMIALNVKSDGLSPHLSKIANEVDFQNAFFFDMSIPEHLQYKIHDLPTYVRESEFEHSAEILADAKGIWMDCFTDEAAHISEERIASLKQTIICYVSPELHGRNPLPLWERLAELSPSHLFQLCTDRPLEAAAFFGEK